MITIISSDELEIGKVYPYGLSDAQGDWLSNPTPFRVVSESTREKYEECIKSHNGVMASPHGDAWFYDVVMD